MKFENLKNPDKLQYHKLYNILKNNKIVAEISGMR